MHDVIHTPRLTLLRLTDSSPSSPHLRYFHANWSDPDITSRSRHGPCADLEESREWMQELVRKGVKFYAVFVRDVAKEETGDEDGGGEGKVENRNLGTLIGHVHFRPQDEGPTLPPPPPPPVTQIASAAAPTAEQTEAPLHIFALGYGFFSSFWHLGYATESNRALIDAYSASLFLSKAKCEKTYYLEALAAGDNPASVRVLEKLGFARLGWEAEDLSKPVREGYVRSKGHWVFGVYV